jgi:hypothetical protein
MHKLSKIQFTSVKIQETSIKNFGYCDLFVIWDFSLKYRPFSIAQSEIHTRLKSLFLPSLPINPFRRRRECNAALRQASERP